MLGACATVLQGGDADAAVVCAQVLALIGQLYGIERAAATSISMSLGTTAGSAGAGQTHFGETALRTCGASEATALPKSPLGAAVRLRARNQWVALTRYTEDGRLKIDNNGAEQALRVDRARPQELALRGQRSGGAPDRRAVFASADVQTAPDQSVRLLARRHRACLDASGATGLGAYAAGVEAPAPADDISRCVGSRLDHLHPLHQNRARSCRASHAPKKRAQTLVAIGLTFRERCATVTVVVSRPKADAQVLQLAFGKLRQRKPPRSGRRGAVRDHLPNGYGARL